MTRRGFWDERFSEPGFAYGEQPNVFLRKRLAAHPPGALLLPAEGEGRNAVWAAAAGWRVLAFDTSTVGRDKALDLANRRSVSITYELRSVADDLSDLEGRFDAVGLVYLHLPPQLRTRAHRAVARALAPGGILVSESFASEQLELGTGGPREPSLLYELADLEDDFRELEIVEAVKTEIDLAEGRYHLGRSCVNRLVAFRPL